MFIDAPRVVPTAIDIHIPGARNNKALEHTSPHRHLPQQNIGYAVAVDIDFMQDNFCAYRFVWLPCDNGALRKFNNAIRQLNHPTDDLGFGFLQWLRSRKYE